MDLLIPASSIAVVIGLVQVYKLSVKSSRLAPAVSIIFGIGIAFLTVVPFNLRQIILHGIINGLSAAGLYSGTKAVIRPTESSTDPLA
jgi:hypothetical protein